MSKRLITCNGRPNDRPRKKYLTKIFSIYMQMNFTNGDYITTNSIENLFLPVENCKLAPDLNQHFLLFKGRLIYWFCLEKRPWVVSPRPLPPPQEMSNSKMIIWLWCRSLCPGQMGLGQNILQQSFSRAAIKDEHNQYLLHIFWV